jgi:formimidoylglutamate deiminase
MTHLFAAQALLPDGWMNNVLVEIKADGHIDKVTPAAEPTIGALNLGILLPAPVNVHSHAFQRAMAGLTERRGPDPSDSFWTWRQLMFRFLDRLTPDHVEAIAAFVQMEMLEAGYATNVEFHYLHHRPGGRPYDNVAEMADRIVAATTQTGIGLTLLPVHYQFGGCDRRDCRSRECCSPALPGWVVARPCAGGWVVDQARRIRYWGRPKMLAELPRAILFWAAGDRASSRKNRDLPSC